MVNGSGASRPSARRAGSSASATGPGLTERAGRRASRCKPGARGGVVSPVGGREQVRDQKADGLRQLGSPRTRGAQHCRVHRTAEADLHLCGMNVLLPEGHQRLRPPDPEGNHQRVRMLEIASDCRQSGLHSAGAAARSLDEDQEMVAAFLTRANGRERVDRESSDLAKRHDCLVRGARGALRNLDHSETEARQPADWQREDLRAHDHREPVRDLLETGGVQESVDDVGVYEGQMVAEKDDRTSSRDLHEARIDQLGARLEHNAMDRPGDPASHEIGGMVPPVLSRAGDPGDRSPQGRLREVSELGGDERQQPFLVAGAPLGDHSRDFSNVLAALIARVHAFRHRCRNIGQMPARSRRRHRGASSSRGGTRGSRARGLRRSRTAGL